jgi:methylenetetrahydrofolate reductase (NADPH)
VKAAKRLKDAGYEPVPHIAARRIVSRQKLETSVKGFTQDAGVRDVLVIGGSVPKQAGDFGSTMEVLETGLFDKFGITNIGVAGHPEGSPDFSEETALGLMKFKKGFAERTGAKVRLVTQFGFDPLKFIEWAEGLAKHGVDLPVHLGVAGPAKMTTIIKYAMACGVGNSLNFLKKRASAVALLTARYSPEDVMDPIEQHVVSNPKSAIKQVHIFPFGGAKQASKWLGERGSWVIADQFVSAE